jgi:hypothetical protein
VIQLNGHCERTDANQKNGERVGNGSTALVPGLPRRDAPPNDDFIVRSLVAGAVKETLNKSLARIASLLWAHCCVENARHSYGYACAFLLALHPKPRRAASRGLIQCFLI